MNIATEENKQQQYVEFSKRDSTSTDLMSQIDQIEADEDLYLTQFSGDSDVGFVRHVSTLLTGVDHGKDLAK